MGFGVEVRIHDVRVQGVAEARVVPEAWRARSGLPWVELGSKGGSRVPHEEKGLGFRCVHTAWAWANAWHGDSIPGALSSNL